MLSQAKSGDQQAFSELCLRYDGMLKQKIFRIVRHSEDTEDILQDTFLSAYKHLHAFRETCQFSTWLTKIGINVSLMLLRKRKKLSEIFSDEIADDKFEAREFRDPGPDPEQDYITDYLSRTGMDWRGRVPAFRIPPINNVRSCLQD